MNAGGAGERSEPIAVSEAAFRRQVLQAQLPVLVAFVAAGCAASRALRPMLRDVAARYAGRLRVASVSAERAADLAELYGVAATPTLLVVQRGAVVTRAVGFLPAPLLHLLAGQAAEESLPPDPLWSPLESTFEDLVLLPLLGRWGLTHARQFTSAALARGRVDVLAYDGDAPLTLFESKRSLLSEAAVREAAAQANRYAAALGLPSFVVAAPPGLWVYARREAKALLVRRVSALELAQEPGEVLVLLRALAR
jgi:thiol-disulfide isomerase/thioredoxin